MPQCDTGMLCAYIVGVRRTKRRKTDIETKKSLQSKIGTTGKHPLVGVDGFEPPTLCL